MMQEFYRFLVICKYGDEQFLLLVLVVIIDLSFAEMIKYVVNFFLVIKISFVNEIVNICDCVGVDVIQVVKGIGLDFCIGNKFLQVGFGWGGFCFLKDIFVLVYIVDDYGCEVYLLKVVVEVNRC